MLPTWVGQLLRLIVIVFKETEQIREETNSTTKFDGGGNGNTTTTVCPESIERVARSVGRRRDIDETCLGDEVMVGMTCFDHETIELLTGLFTVSMGPGRQVQVDDNLRLRRSWDDTDGEEKCAD